MKNLQQQNKFINENHIIDKAEILSTDYHAG